MVLSRHMVSFALGACLSILALPACKDGAASPAEVRDQKSSQDVSRTDQARQDAPPADVPDVQEDPCPPLLNPDAARWYHGGLGYEIFVRSFADSDGDGIGDLNGIRQHLDYLNDGNPETSTDLGVTWIWLTPIFASPSYHGYDATDYRTVNPQYGTMQDLKDLVQACHDRGIRVILDLVMNHVSKDHPWFQAALNTGGATREWFVWSDTQLPWTQPWGNSPVWHKAGNSYYYGIFWSGMPDLNYKNPAVKAEMLDVARYWVKQAAIDGYRLDAVRYLFETGPKEGQQDVPETLAYWKEFATALLSEFPELMLVGEAWASNSIAALYRVNGEGLNMTFDFDLMEALVAGIGAEDSTDIEGVFCRFPTQFPPSSSEVSFLSNHDLTRIFTRFKGNMAAMKLAAALLFTLPGTPMIYYGDELGQSNGAMQMDEHKRLPMQWDDTANAGFTTGSPWQKPAADFATVNVKAQDGTPDSLLNWYRKLALLRRSTPALNQGGFLRLTATSPTTPNVWAFLRTSADQAVKPALVVVNFSANPALNVSVTLPEGTPAPASMLWPTTSTLPAPTDSVLLIGDLAAQSLIVAQ